MTLSGSTWAIQRTTKRLLTRNRRTIDARERTVLSLTLKNFGRYVVQETDRNGQPYFVYMSDNWVHGGPNGLIDASYVWLPIQFEENDVVLKPLTSWDLEDPFAPPPPPPPSPPPPPCPSAGNMLRLQPCNASSPGMQWSLEPTTGKLTLRGSGLCAAPVSTSLLTWVRFASFFDADRCYCFRSKAPSSASDRATLQLRCSLSRMAWST